MKCIKHPDYKLLHRPVSMCPVCWKAWALKLEEEKQKLEETIKDMYKYRRYYSA